MIRQWNDNFFPCLWILVVFTTTIQAQEQEGNAWPWVTAAGVTAVATGTTAWVFRGPIREACQRGMAALNPAREQDLRAPSRAQIAENRESLPVKELGHLDFGVRESMGNFTDLESIEAFEVRNDPGDRVPVGYFSTSSYLSGRYGRVIEVVHFAFPKGFHQEMTLDRLKSQSRAKGQKLMIRVDADSPGDTQWLRSQGFTVGKILRRTRLTPHGEIETRFNEMVWDPQG